MLIKGRASEVARHGHEMNASGDFQEFRGLSPLSAIAYIEKLTTKSALRLLTLAVIYAMRQAAPTGKTSFPAGPMVQAVKRPVAP
jgi:hypothetical protein